MKKNFNILIIGGGPTGVVLTNILGQYGIDVLLIETQQTVYPIPRATHIDEETLRNFQRTGLLPQLAPHTSPFGAATICNNKGRIIFTEQIAQDDNIHHFSGSRFFDQPAFETGLWQGLNRYACVQVLRGFTAIEVSQDAEKVTVKLMNNTTKETSTYTANWLVGCDGGRSMVRAAIHTDMTTLEPARNWVIVDSLLKNEADATLLPQEFRYIFDKERLTIYAHGFGLNRRWEFQLGKNETMPADAVIQSWVAQYISLDKINITRIAKYAHHSLVANTWMQQRIILAGDAAHMMPPSAGQGLCSGIRDAVNLGWKLAAVAKGQASATLLNTYEQERRQHLNSILKRTLFFSRTVNGDTYLQKWWRYLTINCIEAIAPLKNYLRKKYNMPPALQKGFLCNTNLAGTHLPQYLLNNGQLTDDLQGNGFVLVYRPGSTTQLQLHGSLLYDMVKTDSNIFLPWLDKHGIDFALVRPDKIIYAAGSADAWPRVQQGLLNMFSI